MNIRKVTAFWFLSLLLAVFSAAAQAQDKAWPRSLPLEGGSITIYPLQIDALEGDVVRYRAALAYKKPDSPDPVFGAGWFESRVEIDRGQGIVHPLDLKVVDTRFPDGTDEIQPELDFIVAQHAPTWNLDFPLQDLLGALETAKLEAQAAQNINTAPPTILYRDHPALLVNIDGEPVLRSIENSPYQAVINTPYPLIFDGASYFLGAAKGVWFRAERATGPYRYDARPPAGIVAMVDDGAGEEEGQGDVPEQLTAEDAPEIIVATTPTELIVTEGPAAFEPLVDDLLVLGNSDDDVFMHISSQQYYAVFAGRWYHAPSLNGPWTYRAADALPAAFANIPKYSDQADSRVYVAGTEEAKEAVLEAQIPQPATVSRGTVDLDVSYDGSPSFEPVEGTDDLAYADNADATVLRDNHEYYLVEDGVWYVSSSPDGPWVVSDYRPVEVASISPRSPVYNVKYVYIYDSTPEVVYVGYTPGYFGSYVYYDTIVYGTGWYYRPWISPRYYYPRYHTWGFSVAYTPWYGWSFGLSWGWGPFYADYYSGGFWHHGRSWHNRRYSYWGPAGYRPRPWRHDHRYAHNYGHDYRNPGHDSYFGRHGRTGNDRGIYGWNEHDRNRNGPVGRDRNERGRYHPNYGGQNTNAYVRDRNLYRDRTQRARISERADAAGRPRNSERNLASNRNAPRLRDTNPVQHERLVSREWKGSQSRTGPVRRSELRVKAQVRDAGRSIDPKRLIADNSGYNRRQTQAAIETRDWKRHVTSSRPIRASQGTTRFADPRNTESGRMTQRRSAVSGNPSSEPRSAERTQTQRYSYAPSTTSRGTTQVRSAQGPVRSRPAPQRMISPQASVQHRNSPPRSAPQAGANTGPARHRSSPPSLSPQREVRNAGTPRPESRKQSSRPESSGGNSHEGGGRRGGHQSRRRG